MEQAPPPPPRRLLVYAAIGALACVWIRGYEKQLKSMDDVPEVAQDVLRRFNWTDELEYHFEKKRRPSQDVDGTAKHPLVMVPGIISCGLELWQPGECFGDDFFRTRLWGGLGMGRAILRNFSCWLSHMTLDADTGLDQGGRCCAGLVVKRARSRHRSREGGGLVETENGPPSSAHAAWCN